MTYLERERQFKEQVELCCHKASTDDANKQPYHPCGKNYNEGFVHVYPTTLCLCDTHGSKHTVFPNVVSYIRRCCHHQKKECETERDKANNTHEQGETFVNSHNTLQQRNFVDHKDELWIQQSSYSIYDVLSARFSAVFCKIY